MSHDTPWAGGPPRWPSSPLAIHPATTATDVALQPHHRQGSQENVTSHPTRLAKLTGKENAAPNDRSRGRNVSPTKALLAKAMSAARAASPERRATKEANSGARGRGGAAGVESKASKQQKPKGSDVHRPLSDSDVAASFANLLTELQVAPEQRKRLLAMDIGVKAAMLKGSSTLNLSSFGLESPKKARTPLPQVSDDHQRPLAGPTTSSSTGLWRQGSAEDIFSGVPASDDAKIGGPSSPRKGRNRATSLVGSSGGSSREAALASMASDTAISLATLLKTTCASKLDISRMKRLRAVISSESPSWIADFADEGGIRALLARLKELIDMEWREEQHDDMVLHEILRCLIALSNTDRGKTVLSTAHPSPFVDLTTLLFSEKKPGDLVTRKYLVDLLTLVIDMPVSDILSTDDDVVQRSRQLSSCWTSASASASTYRLSPGLLLLLCLLHNPRSPEKEAVLDFITASHNPRPFKTYVVELGGVCRDYFWVFCHAKNRYWDLRQVDVRAVEGPKVPGGMTGGVEFEAMAYLTSNLRLVNKVGTALLAGAPATSNNQAAPSAALDFHRLLFASGLERVLSTLRRASQNYYAPLHLELARYMDLATRSGFTLPPNLAVWRSGNQALPLAPMGGRVDMTRPLSTQVVPTPPSPSKDEAPKRRAASPSRAERLSDRPRPVSAFEAMRRAQKAQEASKGSPSSSTGAPSHVVSPISAGSPVVSPTSAGPSSYPSAPSSSEQHTSMLPSPSLNFPSEPDLSFHFSLGTFSTTEREQLDDKGEGGKEEKEPKRSSTDAWLSTGGQGSVGVEPSGNGTAMSGPTTSPTATSALPSSPLVHPRLFPPSLTVAQPSSPLMPAWRHADLGVRREGGAGSGGGANSHSTGTAQGSIVGTAIRAWESRGRPGSGEGAAGASPYVGLTRRV